MVTGVWEALWAGTLRVTEGRGEGPQLFRELAVVS